jgi:hypothetical protein
VRPSAVAALKSAQRARGERGRVPIKPQDVWTRERKVIDFGPLNASYGLNLDLNAGSTYGA